MANVTRNPFIKVFFAILVTLMLLNVPPVSILINVLDRDDCSFATEDGGFVCYEYSFKDNTFENHCLPVFNGFKEFVKRRDSRFLDYDTSHLLRTKPRNWLRFWHYREYLFDSKYNVPFKSWSEIEKNKVLGDSYVR